MIADPTLAHWLADRDSQAETFAGIEASSHRHRTSAWMREIERELKAIGRPGADAVMGLAARVFKRTDAIEATLAALITDAHADPFFRPPLKPVSSKVHLGLLLLDAPALSILLAITSVDGLAAKRSFNSGPSSISFVGQKSLFKFLKSGGAELSFGLVRFWTI